MQTTLITFWCQLCSHNSVYFFNIQWHNYSTKHICQEIYKCAWSTHSNTIKWDNQDQKMWSPYASEKKWMFCHLKHWLFWKTKPANDQLEYDQITYAMINLNTLYNALSKLLVQHNQNTKRISCRVDQTTEPSWISCKWSSINLKSENE